MTKIKIIGISYFIVLLILALNVKANPILYDDFSSNVLDSSKWTENQTYEHWPFLDEHYVNTSEQMYHQAQPTIVGDRETLLISIRTFNPGETLDYDVYYVSGEGKVIGAYKRHIAQGHKISKKILPYITNPFKSAELLYQYLDNIIHSQDLTNSQKIDVIRAMVEVNKAVHGQNFTSKNLNLNVDAESEDKFNINREIDRIVQEYAESKEKNPYIAKQKENLEFLKSERSGARAQQKDVSTLDYLIDLKEKQLKNLLREYQKDGQYNEQKS